MLNKCLGRKPAVFSPHTPALTALAPTILHYNPQPEIMRGSEIPSWLMGMNNSIGSCTSVGIANILLARNTWAGHTNYPTTADILSFYERFGYKPGQPLTDQGATLLECMQSWMQQGYPVRNTINKLKGFAAINFRNLTLLKTAIEIFGDVYTGVNLTVAQQTQTVWDYVPNDQEWGGHCFTGETKIPLLDGTEKEIKEFKPGERFWVYSINDKNRIVPGQAVALGCTRKKVQIIEITLDNDEKIKCTPDHKFMLRNGKYTEAKNLKKFDSLMPLYRTITQSQSYPGYEKTFNPQSGKWILTHRLIASANEPIFKGKVVHHADFNKRNNSPDNLNIMTWEAHTKLHADFARPETLIAYSKSEKGREKSRELMKSLWADPVWRANRCIQNGKNGKKTMQKRKEEGTIGLRRPLTDEEKQKISIRGKAIWASYSEQEREEKLENGLRKAAKTSAKRFEEDAEYRKKRREYAKKACIAALKKYYAEGMTESQKQARTNKKNCIKSEKPPPINHKVKEVKFLSILEDVYDIEVEKYHNFALSAGVFVHNCVTLNGFSKDGSFRAVTWAEWMKVTPAFIEHQVEEAYVLLDDASLARAQRTFNDWNMEALAQAVKSLGGQLA